MSNPQNAANVWKSKVLWLNQQLALSELRLRLIPLETLNPLCNQIVIQVGMAPWRGSGPLEILSVVMNQIMFAMNLKKGRWQTWPDHAQCPMLGIHVQHGVGLLKEPNDAKMPWFIETPSGPQLLLGHDTGWLFAPIKVSRFDSQMGRACMQEVRNSGLSGLHLIHLIHLTGLAMGIHVARWVWVWL
jgi:hypothetical protein